MSLDLQNLDPSHLQMALRMTIARRATQTTMDLLPHYFTSQSERDAFIQWMTAEVEKLEFTVADYVELEQLGDEGNHRVGREFMTLVLRARDYVLRRN